MPPPPPVGHQVMYDAELRCWLGVWGLRNFEKCHLKHLPQLLGLPSNEKPLFWGVFALMARMSPFRATIYISKDTGVVHTNPVHHS